MPHPFSWADVGFKKVVVNDIACTIAVGLKFLLEMKDPQCKSKCRNMHVRKRERLSGTVGGHGFIFSVYGFQVNFSCY